MRETKCFQKMNEHFNDFILKGSKEKKVNLINKNISFPELIKAKLKNVSPPQDMTTRKSKLTQSLVTVR